ncbi:MAG: FtsX-like permease family protein, partial [bacterium]|nr:FtsX-like permease family protein [bacterium]
LKFDILLPWKNLEATMGPEYTEAWGHTGSYTYLRVVSGTDPTAFEATLLGLVEAECPWLEEYEMTIDLKMQPLADIHLTSHYMQEYEPNGNRDTVEVLFVIAIFIAIMAWVNFINLSTAGAINRAREVGLRKVVGATRGQLAVQFFFEIMVVNIVAVAAALVLIALALPSFNQLTGLSAGHTMLTQDWLWLTLGAMLVAGVFLSGIYPVIVLSSFRPATMLRGRGGNNLFGAALRRALIVFQFAVGLVLVIATLTVYRQVAYMQNQSTGFAMDQTLVVRAPRVRDDDYATKFETYKETLLARADIERISHVTEVPGRQIYWDAGGIMRAGDDINQSKNYQIVGVDYDFAELFEVEFVAGRNFSREYPTDETGLLFNETAAEAIGFESAASAIGQQVDYWGEIFTVIGVLKDYHQQSPREAFEPHIFRFAPHGRGSMGMITIRVNGADVRTTIDGVRAQYDLFFPGNSFDYFFLDDYYQQQYESDQLFGTVTGLFAALALVIIGLGIYGLSLYSVNRATKEIGIRKVLGASTGSIFGLLTREFVVLIIVANVIAIPTAYFALSR